MALARNLAQSLVRGSWDRETNRYTLKRRLPQELGHLAVRISQQLISALPLTYAPDAKLVARVLSSTPDFARILAFCRKHDVWPSPDLTPPEMAPAWVFAALDVPSLPTINALAEWLFLALDRLEYLADANSRHENHGDAKVNHYHYSLQAKKSGGFRVLEAPKPHLKAAQRKILHGILGKVSVHADAFGFVKGRNCVKAASRHVGEQTVLRFDLKNFFTTVGAARVFGLFRCLGYPHEVARRLTGLCTSSTPMRILKDLHGAERNAYRKPHLPQGAPTSPMLANLSAFTLDRRLAGLARSLGVNYSRYADDLTFSGDRELMAALLRAVPLIIADEGFEPNKAKTCIASRASQQRVTGIVVNDHLNVDRRSFDLLKAIIHACGKPGDGRLDDPVFRSSLEGKISWVDSISPQRGSKLWDLLARSDSRRQA